MIPGGGQRYFPSAYVCVRSIRENGCELPIEMWHLGEGEIDPTMRQAVEPLGVKLVDAHEVQEAPSLPH